MMQLTQPQGQCTQYPSTQQRPFKRKYPPVACILSLAEFSLNNFGGSTRVRMTRYLDFILSPY